MQYYSTMPLNFSDSTTECFSLTSQRQKEVKGTHSASVQTDALKNAEVECQSIGKKEIAVQTVQPESKAEQVHADWQKVSKFLHKVEPMIMKTLQQNLRSKAFMFYHDAMAEDGVEATNTHALKHTSVPNEMQVLCIEWNASGTSIACAYGMSQHEDWCTHKGFVCTWNVERRSMDPSKADISVDIDFCATSLSFHPAQPALIAVGNFNGEVAVYNLANTEGNMMEANSIETDEGHKEPVTCLQWTKMSGSEGYLLCSGSNDGKILLWKLPSRGQDLVIDKALAVAAGSLPRSLRGRISNTEKEAGISGIAFSCKESALFLAGGETGAVLHCNLNSKDPVPTKSDHPVYNPVVLSLRAHQGPVYCVKASPFHRNMFLTASGDGSARVYNILKLDPPVSAYLSSGYLYSCCWSPIRPLVFAVASSLGEACVFDLSENENTPISRLTVNEDKSPVFSVSINPHNSQILATGDGTGTTKLWNLGARFASQEPNEEQKLQLLAARLIDD